ncbi:MAG: hypothetical protein R3C27_09770 [Hyphomonadaceae bacterium]
MTTTHVAPPLERVTADYTTREGASRLSEMIERYWQERGRAVTLALHNAGFHAAIRSARFDIRSDMINGWPRSS